MGTTIAGNQHIGTNYKKLQYIWASGIGGTNAEVELYEEDRIFVYQFYPTYDQRDDGVLAVEFYYYYRKPTTQEFWDYCYDADYYYIYPFLAWYDDEEADGGKWGGIISYDSQKISLVGRDSGWIHVTLHVEEYIWGKFVNTQGKIINNNIYIGIYSPLPVFVWDNSVSGSDTIIPYEIMWDFEEYEDESVYDLLTGGYLEECYWKRKVINDYPSFYITYRDVTPEAFNYAVMETAVMNVTSGVSKKSVYKKIFADVQTACGTTDRKLDYIRRLYTVPNVETELVRKQVLFRSLMSESDFTARPFVSRLFLRTVQNVVGFWDWLRGKIRDANNVITLFCPIHTEITLECRI